MSWTSCRCDKQSIHAFPSFPPEPHVDLACSSHSRFHFFSWLVCRHCKQSKLTFPAFFPGQVDHVASNPTTRFHSFSSFACQHRDQRERALLFFNAFPFFVSGPLADATNSTHKRFHLSVLRRMSTWHAAHTRVSMFFLFRPSV